MDVEGPTFTIRNDRSFFNQGKVFCNFTPKEHSVPENLTLQLSWILKTVKRAINKNMDQKFIHQELPRGTTIYEFLELCLLKNKFSIEKCKKKIEMYFTMKGDPHYEYVYDRIPVPSKEPLFHTPLPMLTEDYKRLFVFKIYDEENYDMVKDVNCNAVMREFILRWDYNDGEIHIIDLRDCSSGIISKVRLNILADGINLIVKGCSSRLSEIHIVSRISRTLFSTIISLMPKKLVSRLLFHDSEESLKKAIPAKYLPSDFGGELQSMKNFNAEWDIIFEENLEYLRTLINTKSREELRQGESWETEEIQGTFKKLNID